MSYQVLARKWRPQNFEQLVGQEHVLRALVNALENERLHHAYLFAGTRGVGKTTIARILARALNCETGITATPCGECSACQEISEGRFVDLIEVDAASRTKVEDTRDLLENVQYRPTRGRFKIYLIDEVHMLSNHSFNALLKTLEEPPEHVKFLLATTDPHKLPVTVLSRCLQFNLKNLPAMSISEYLAEILDIEKIPFEKNALGHLARAASGSMRDALSLTDQAISHGGGKLAEQDIVEMLGTVDRKRIYQIVEAIGDKDGAALIALCQDLAQYSIDYLALLEEMLALFHAVAVCQMVPDADQSNFGDVEQIAKLASALDPEDVQLNYQILLIGRKDLVACPDMHMGFEMLMLRLLAFQPEVGSAKPARSLSNNGSEASEVDTAKKPEAAATLMPHLPETNKPLEKAPPVATTQTSSAQIEHQAFDGQKPRSKISDQVQPDQNEAAEKASVDEVASNNQAFNTASGSHEVDDVPPWEHVPETNDGLQTRSSADSPPPAGVSETVIEPSGTVVIQAKLTEPDDRSQSKSAIVAGEGQLSAPETLAALSPENWIALYRLLPLDGVIKSVTSHMVLERQENGQLFFKLAESGQALYNANHPQRLADMLTAHFRSPSEVHVEFGDVHMETPAESARRLHQEALNAAETRILNDPIVTELMSEFQATLVPDSVVFSDEK